MPELIKKRPITEVVEKLKSNPETALNYASDIIADARLHNQGIANYLRLSVDTKSDDQAAKDYSGLNGFEAVLAGMNIPIQEDLDAGITMRMAGEAFTTYPGSRLLFPEVVDQVLRAKSRLNTVENTAAIVGNSRTVVGNELICSYYDAAGSDDTFTIAEMGRIPVTRIGTTQNNVAFYKHGSGYEFSYEFDRRAAVDILVPYAARILRRAEISKVAALTYTLINGDGVNPAAATYNLSNYGANYSGGKTLKDNYRALTTFLMEFAQAGYTFDKLVCNFRTYVELMFMFAPVAAAGLSVPEYMAQNRGMINVAPLDILGGTVQVALSSTVPANKIICEIQAECCEELVEANSDISESEKAIRNQSITYVRTQNTGYKLVFPDSRVLLDVAN